MFLVLFNKFLNNMKFDFQNRLIKIINKKMYMIKHKQLMQINTYNKKLIIFIKKYHFLKVTNVLQH